ncbi:MAG: cyclase family protein [Bdellovibrionaceae bacterium]|nr:cyclase family protein [Bdellovibrio sp.]
MSLDLLQIASKKIIDITPKINSKMAVFPGDTPFQEEFVMDFKSGHNLTLSNIKTTVHLGAHTDAPSHYHADGVSIDQRSLHYYLGKAQVIEVETKKNHRITPQDFNTEIKAPRVLFKTKSFPDPYQWTNDFMSFSAELIEYLNSKKVILVGIDTPSVDLATDRILQSHTAIHEFNMAILEGIVLDHVEPGLYDLIALPLNIEGADATPVRAILIK